MKKTVLIRMFALVCMGILFSGHSWAQQEDKSKRPSPPATAKGKIKDATITVDYSAPSVKGRKIWGGLVPYNELWRVGANEATIFSTDKDIEVEGKKLPAGKYSLFMLPTEKEWTVYFNSETGQWGDNRDGKANMDPKKVVLEVKVKPHEELRVQEKMVFEVVDRPMDKGLELRWDKLRLLVSIK